MWLGRQRHCVWFRCISCMTLTLIWPVVYHIVSQVSLGITVKFWKSPQRVILLLNPAKVLWSILSIAGPRNIELLTQCSRLTHGSSDHYLGNSHYSMFLIVICWYIDCVKELEENLCIELYSNRSMHTC